MKAYFKNGAVINLIGFAIVVQSKFYWLTIKLMVCIMRVATNYSRKNSLTNSCTYLDQGKLNRPMHEATSTCSRTNYRFTFVKQCRIGLCLTRVDYIISKLISPIFYPKGGFAVLTALFYEITTIIQSYTAGNWWLPYDLWWRSYRSRLVRR